MCVSTARYMSYCKAQRCVHGYLAMFDDFAVSSAGHTRRGVSTKALAPRGNHYISAAISVATNGGWQPSFREVENDVDIANGDTHRHRRRIAEVTIHVTQSVP